MNKDPKHRNIEEQKTEERSAEEQSVVTEVPAVELVSASETGEPSADGSALNNDRSGEGEQLEAKREGGVLGWLYYRSGITVSALNKVIIFGMIAMIALFIYFASTSKGFLIVFNSRGGTDVPSQRILYGDTIELPDPPTREGYTFVGWSHEQESHELYDPTTPVDIGFELFAQWEPVE